MDLKEDEDFYFEPSGLMVFTEVYHLKRGYCCESQCRHCPYRPAEKSLAQKVVAQKTAGDESV